MLAPICLFVYQRLEETKETIRCLSRNDLANESDLYIFSDGPKDAKSAAKVDEVREFVRSVSGFKSVTVVESETNKGLAASIIDGVSRIVSEYGKVIVVEDDILTSGGFLTYMNNALDHYEDDHSVMQISAFMHPIDTAGLPDTFFYQANSCWGWATWHRSWRFFKDDPAWLLQELKSEGISWDAFNSMQGREFQKQLLRNINGKITTWAVKWHAMIKLKGGTVLHPKSSYISNIGFAGDGENCPRGTSVGEIDDTLDLDVTAAQTQSADEALRRLGAYCKQRFSFWGKCKRRLSGYGIHL